MRRTIYLSGPITGKKDYFEIFDNAADQLLEIDPELIIINPAAMIQVNDDNLSACDYNRIIDIDLSLVTKCDAICLLPEWESSKGCRRELAAALEEGLDIFLYNDSELFDKLNKAKE